MFRALQPSEALGTARGARRRAPGHPSARGDRGQSAALSTTSGQLAWGYMWSYGSAAFVEVCANKGS
jgi:hypothetical protein